MDCDTHLDTIVAALLYLVTACYPRPCPALAACFARHFACFAGHPDAARVLRDVARGSVCMWETAARGFENTDSRERSLAALQ
jgi:hypothetical protein